MAENAKLQGGRRLTIRMSIRELEKPENAAKKNAFLRAWKLIKELPPNNPNSFWALGGYHGQPFRPPYDEDASIDRWGGYCQHANVLFPTWHRFHMLRLEQALQTVCPNDDISLAYWDTTSELSLKEGLPKLLTADKVTIDGKEEENPLKSFKFPVEMSGVEADELYNKPKGYETVRYPYSGIRSPPAAAEVAHKHNNVTVPEMLVEQNTTATSLLNENIIQWLNGPAPNTRPNNRGTLYKFKACLETESYNDFSNTSSSGKSQAPTESLEGPHNDLHLAIGGFDLPGLENRQAGIIQGANGDMGENETAGFDPSFFFHHCNVDRVFWIWQKKHGMTRNFDIDPNDDAGTNVSAPTIGQQPNEKLTMDTILYPFQHANGVPVTSRDTINIHRLGYEYTIGSLDQTKWPKHEKNGVRYIQPESADLYGKDPSFRSVYNMVDPSKFDRHLSNNDGFFIKIDNINRDLYQGSKLVRLYYKERSPENFIMQASILSRWNEKICKNCQHHRSFSAWFDCHSTPVIFNWPPKSQDFITAMVHFDPIQGKYIETPISVDAVVGGPKMTYCMAQGSHGHAYYPFME